MSSLQRLVSDCDSVGSAPVNESCDECDCYELLKFDDDDGIARQNEFDYLTKLR